MSNQFIDNLKGKYITFFCSVKNIGGPMLLKLKSSIAALIMYIMIMPNRQRKFIVLSTFYAKILKGNSSFFNLKMLPDFLSKTLWLLSFHNPAYAGRICVPDLLSLIV